MAITYDRFQLWTLYMVAILIHSIHKSNKLYIESDREVTGEKSAPIEHSWSDCTGKGAAPVQPYSCSEMWLYWHDYSRQRILISCVLMAQIFLPQPPCHSLYITYYFMNTMYQYSHHVQRSQLKYVIGYCYYCLYTKYFLFTKWSPEYERCKTHKIRFKSKYIRAGHSLFFSRFALRSIFIHGLLSLYCSFCRF